ncbi:flavin reductase family protein [Streptomyces mirabilis]|uniref:flavin reductase family protein n=1 Tax=Streptomyces mirabilis TaxID=68239 RepID=UPI0033BF8927
MTAAPISDTSARQAFRDAMATVASPVAMVTAMDGRHPHGTTVSAFASLCPAPPMVLVSLDNRSHLLAIIRRTDRSSARSSSATDTDASTAGLQPVAAPPCR